MYLALELEDQADPPRPKPWYVNVSDRWLLLAVIALALALIAAGFLNVGSIVARGAAGDFIAGTLGVAGTLIGSVLGILLAKSALTQAHTSEELARQAMKLDEAIEYRDRARFVRDDVRARLEIIQAVARAYQSFVSESIRLLNLGQLRDKEAKAILEELSQKSRVRSALSQEDLDRAKQAQLQYSELTLFPDGDLIILARALEKLSAACDALYWSGDSKILLNPGKQRLAVIRRAVEAVAPPELTLARIVSQLLYSDDVELLAIAQLLNRKALLLPLEVKTVSEAGKKTRLYLGYLKQTWAEEGVAEEARAVCVMSLVSWFVDHADKESSMSSLVTVNYGIVILAAILALIPEADELERTLLDTPQYRGYENEVMLTLKGFDLTLGLTDIRTAIIDFDRLSEAFVFPSGAFTLKMDREVELATLKELLNKLEVARNRQGSPEERANLAQLLGEIVSILEHESTEYLLELRRLVDSNPSEDALAVSLANALRNLTVPILRGGVQSLTPDEFNLATAYLEDARQLLFGREHVDGWERIALGVAAALERLRSTPGALDASEEE